MTVARQNGFGGAVNLSVAGLTARAGGASFSPNPAQSSSTLTVTTKKNAPADVYSLTITGTSGSLVRTTSVQLTIR